MSILAVPGALATLGAVGGALSIVGWQILNTHTQLSFSETSATAIRSAIRLPTCVVSSLAASAES